jgi:hypothetical protein
MILDVKQLKENHSKFIYEGELSNKERIKWSLKTK